jgi:N-acetyl-anhydromuramyl-L-alanine amidase AmpD
MTTTLTEYSQQQEAKNNIANAVLGHTYALCEALRQNFIDYSIRSHQLRTSDVEYHDAQIAKLKQGICDYEFYPETGKKYHKIVMNANGSRSVHCFIDKKTGSVFKSASWRSPAKGERYNLLLIKDREWLLENADWAGSYLYAK